jgi:hypothetical protein
VSAREHVAPNQGEISESSNVHEGAAAALVTVGAMVAVADRHVLAVERDEVVPFINDLGLPVHLTEPRLVAMFDERARRLEQRDFSNIVIDALRPVSDLSLSSDLLVVPAYTGTPRGEDALTRRNRRPELSDDRSFNVNAISDESRSSVASTTRYSAGGDWRLEALIDRLPQRVGGAVSYLLQPKSRWIRIPAGVLLICRVDYLRRLGVDVIWLTPIYKSPMMDLEYDIADFCAVDPILGTLEDFDRLLNTLHYADPWPQNERRPGLDLSQSLDRARNARSGPWRLMGRRCGTCRQPQTERLAKPRPIKVVR